MNNKLEVKRIKASCESGIKNRICSKFSVGHVVCGRKSELMVDMLLDGTSNILDLVLQFPTTQTYHLILLIEKVLEPRGLAL